MLSYLCFSQHAGGTAILQVLLFHILREHSLCGENDTLTCKGLFAKPRV